MLKSYLQTLNYIERVTFNSPRHPIKSYYLLHRPNLKKYFTLAFLSKENENFCEQRAYSSVLLSHPRTAQTRIKPPLSLGTNKTGLYGRLCPLPDMQLLKFILTKDKRESNKTTSTPAS